MAQSLPMLPSAKQVHDLSATEAVQLTKEMNTASPRDALVNIIAKALRSEAGVRYNQQRRKDTGYYSGRRTGFVCSAAVLIELLYGGDYEAAKSSIAASLREAGETWPVGDLYDPAKGGELATKIATSALTQH